MQINTKGLSIEQKNLTLMEGLRLVIYQQIEKELYLLSLHITIPIQFQQIGMKLI